METQLAPERSTPRPWRLPDGAPSDFEPQEFYLGEGRHPLEVALASAPDRPTKGELLSLWRKRQGRTPSPLLLMVEYDGQVAACGSAGEEPGVYRDLEPGKAVRVAEESLQEPNRNAAIRYLEGTLPDLQSSLSGLKNEGMFAIHELNNGVPNSENYDWEWAEKCQEGREALGLEGRELIKKLGFSIDSLGVGTDTLRADGVACAVAVFLNEDERPEVTASRFGGNSPVASALAKADAERREFVVVAQGSKIRVYSSSRDKGVGRKGRTETYVEIDTTLLSEEKAGYLPLLCGAEALRPEGTFDAILRESRNFATGLSERLRDRVYGTVVPQIAKVLARRHDDQSKEDLDALYETAMMILFRLLFVAYGEDKDLLPYRSNRLYKRRSLKGLAQELSRRANEGENKGEVTFDDSATSMWAEVSSLWSAINQGNSDLGVPEYNGGLFSSDADINPRGEYISELELTNEEIGPALFNLLVDQTEEEVFGPVDFRSLSVREFGTVYEGLLESTLARAPFDLTLDSDDRYVPAEDGDEVEVSEGDIYLQHQSGKRKETGTYFTKPFAVEHLLEQGLEPALSNHLSRIEDLIEEGKETEAAEAFFDFRCADIAMGSGHFLVAAVDYIEAEFSNFLATHDLPKVSAELDKLRSAAHDHLQELSEDVEIDRSSLLRRQIARRCVYGVDQNSIAVELARLALWIHTFVPGLPLSFLNHNIVQGNSLSGIGTIQEALEALGADDGESSIPLWRQQIYSQLERAETALETLGQIADASATEIKQAEEAHHEAMEAVQPIRDLFHLLAAARQKEHVSYPTDISAKDIQENEYLDEARELADQQDSLHFPVVFPEVFLRERSGFDCILGNPPWEEAEVEKNRFWTRHFPGFVTKSPGRKEELLDEYKERRPDLVEEYEQQAEKTENLRNMLLNGPYPGMSSGDPDLYKAFSWRFWALCRSDGYLGVVLPRTALVSEGSSEWREKVVNEGGVQDITILVNNRHWVFEDVHPQYTIGLLSIKKSGAPNPIRLSGPFYSREELHEGRNEPPVVFDNEDFRSATSNLAFPLLPSEDEGRVFKRLIESPRLDSDQHNWSCRPVRELDASLDKEHMIFDPDDTSGLWPVCSGASFKIWKPDTGKKYAWADPDYITKMLYEKRKRQHRHHASAFYSLPDEWIEDQNTLDCLRPRLAFRQISRATDTRTMICALVPPNRILTNAAPYFLFQEGNRRDEAFLLAVLSSVPLDWYARRVVEMNINFHILNAFPIPYAERSNDLRKRAEEITGTLAAVDDRYEDWADAVGVPVGGVSTGRKEELVAELDAVVAHLYGLEKSDLTLIYDTFHEEWDPETRKEKALDYFADHQQHQ